jgi:adenylate kinase family enzyme
MRIAIVGASTAGKTTLAKKLQDYIGHDLADVIDLDSFINEKWNLPDPGLRRLRALDQSELLLSDRGKTIHQLETERESEFQDRLDHLRTDRVTILALRTHSFQFNASNYPHEPRKQWWDRLVADAAHPAKRTYILRLAIDAETIFERIKERHERYREDFPDLTDSFARWSEPTLWSNGVLRDKKQIVRDLHQNQIVELFPHYCQFPHLLVNQSGPHITAAQALERLALPSIPTELLARLSDRNSSTRTSADQKQVQSSNRCIR